MVQRTRWVLTASVGLALSGGLFAAAPTVTTEDFVDKLDSPWDMAFMKDETMFFTEKCKGFRFDFRRAPQQAHSPNQMGAMEPKKRSAFMPMTDLKTYPKAMKPAWNNKGLSQGMFCNAFLSGPQWKDWDGQMVVGFAGIGIHGTSVGNRLDRLKISADGSSATKTDFSWPTVAGRFRGCDQGPDGNLYVALEDQGKIIRVKPQ